MARVVRLTWGVKQSFRGYVEAAGGTIGAEGGAERTADGAFSFAAGPGQGLSFDEDGAPAGLGAFVGEAKFDAHGGMLKVCLADPAVEIGPQGLVLTAADSVKRDWRGIIATLDLAAMTTGEDGELIIPAALAMDGIQVLGDHYPMRTPLDPVRLTLA
ncbi:HtaA domain-containing protein [Phenylobacterium sp.]|uniref:HtaA domain-containing protein n=1 Tax=Phenylobacterium sp. TaxID=1871053 RepID=UPI00286C86D7|nr:HtaA domain-containing protein [Phenylobacterium sp.]